MGLLKDVGILLSRGVHYGLQKRARDELGHAVRDMIFGASVTPKDESRVYMDLHAHLYDTVPIDRLVEEAAQRVDVLAITERPFPDDVDHLTYQRALEKIRAKGLRHTELGDRMIRVETKHGPLHIVRSMEVYTDQKRGVHVVGHTGDSALQKEHLTLDDVLSAVQRADAFWFFDHQSSKNAPVIAFRYPTATEEQDDRTIDKLHRAVLEIGNHQNTLWMWASDAATATRAQDLGLVGIANSDTHFNYREVGLSRTSVPKTMVDLSSDSAFFASLNTGLQPENRNDVHVDANYARLWDFGRYMITTGLPVVRTFARQWLRQKDFLEDIIVHVDNELGHVASTYATQELMQQKLKYYNTKDALVVIDIDDAVRDSPAKQMAFKSGWKYAPLKTLTWLCYHGPKAAFVDIARHRSIKAGETAAFAAYRTHVLDSLTAHERQALAQEAMSKTPFYNKAEHVIRYFSKASKVIVSRNIAEIVDATADDLGATERYAEQDDKVETILRTSQGKKCVLIFGDSKEDATVIPKLRRLGYVVDFVYVQEKYDPQKIHPDATVAITRNSYAALIT